MAKRDITLRWNDPNLIEKGHLLYRSKTSMTIDLLPEPIASLPKNTDMFIDKDVVFDDSITDDTYYYRVSAWIDGHEQISEEVRITNVPSLYVGMTDGSFASISENGVIKYTSSVAGGSITGIDIDSSGTVYVSSHDRHVRAINPTDGSVIWEWGNHATPDSWGLSTMDVAVDMINDTIYTVDSGAYMRKFNSTGSLVWSYNTGVSRLQNIVVNDAEQAFVNSIPTSRSGRITCFSDINNAAPTSLWSTSVSGETTGITIGADGHPIIGSAYKSSFMKKFSSVDGSLLWTNNDPAAPIMKLNADKNNNVYGRGTNGVIYSIDGSGNLIWSKSLNATNAVYASHERLYYSSNSTVICADTQGNTIWEIGLPNTVSIITPSSGKFHIG